MPTEKHRALADAESCRQVWRYLDQENTPVKALPLINLSKSDAIETPLFDSHLFEEESLEVKCNDNF